MSLVCAFDFSTMASPGVLKNLATTGSVYNGIVNGTYTPAPPLIRAKKSPCMDFDGVNNYISLANPLNGLTDFSIVAWFNCDNVAAFNCLYTPTLNVFRYVSAGPNNLVAYWAGGIKYSTERIQNNNTYMVVFTRAASTISELYVNSTYNARTSVGVVSAEANCFIGQYWDASGRFNGRIDNYLIYNTCLLPEQVKSLYRSANPR